MPTQIDIRQSVLRSALTMAGSGVNAGVDTILIANDPLIQQLYQDRNITLVDGGTITFTGTQIQFTQNLDMVINQALGATAAAVTISLGSANVTLNNGDMWYAILNRSANTATTAIATAAVGLPGVSNANQNIILLAKRFDSADGTQMVYFRTGMSLTAGQSARLGASGGNGSGSGTGDDLDSLNFSVSFTDTFSDLSTSSLTSVDNSAGHTNAVYSPLNKYYTLSYDASKTVTGTGTSMTLSATPAYTVAVGDMLRVGTQARRITVVTSQTAYTIEAAFTTNPTGAAACVSQAVYTKDLNNFAVDGVAPSAIFTGSINSFLLIYNDTTTGTIYNYLDPALIAYTASADGTSYTSVGVRESNPSIEAFANSTPTAGSNLYFRFFSDALTGSGTYNLVGYKTFFQSQNAVESGGVLNQAYAFTNNVGTPYNCTVTGGNGTATSIGLTWNYPVGLNVGGPDGSLQVYLNGQKIPRFISSTLTPDASYLEVSGTAIQLDRDYSSQNLNIEVVQQVYVVDSSTQNTTNISALTSFINNAYEVDRIFSTGTSATFRPDYMFFTASCNATTGATYTNNGVTFTVYQTVAGSAIVIANGNSAPTTSGVLTKTSGTGDTTITFSSWKLPTAIRVKVQGPGGNGGTTTGTTSVQNSVGGGGGGGGYAEKLIYGSLLASSYTYTVGTPGTSSTFAGGSISLTGGSGSTGAGGAAEGVGPIYGSGGATGGTASGGDINCVGQFGWPGIVLALGQYLAGLGGSSVFGFAINCNQVGSGVGVAGQSPGVGGSGASAGINQSSFAGGAGANGVIVIQQHYVGG